MDIRLCERDLNMASGIQLKVFFGSRTGSIKIHSDVV